MEEERISETPFLAPREVGFSYLGHGHSLEGQQMRRVLLSLIFILVIHPTPIWGQPDQDKAVKQKTIVDMVWSGEEAEVKTKEHPEHLSENDYYKLLRVQIREKGLSGKSFAWVLDCQKNLTILYQAKKDVDVGSPGPSVEKLIVDCFDKEGRPMEGTSLNFERGLSKGEIRKTASICLPDGTASFKLRWHSLK